MRSIIRDLILENAELLSIIPEERWLSSGALTEDNSPPCPFGVFRWGTTERGIGYIKRGTVTIWIHDSIGSYQTIDDVLALVTGTLDGKEQVEDGKGNELIVCEWQNNSGDLYDPGYRTLTKNMLFNIIGRGL